MVADHRLEALLRLPHRFVMPNTLFEDEWLCRADAEKGALCAHGLEVIDLPGELVLRAQRYFQRHAALKLNDCFALTLTEELENSILMTGDGPLRRIADGNAVEVRGVLWATDEAEAHGIVTPRILYDALRLFPDDDLVFLPPDEIVRRLRRLGRLL